MTPLLLSQRLVVRDISLTDCFPSMVSLVHYMYRVCVYIYIGSTLFRRFLCDREDRRTLYTHVES